jgi:hypothetical protein
MAGNMQKSIWEFFSRCDQSSVTVAQNTPSVFPTSNAVFIAHDRHQPMKIFRLLLQVF